MQGLTEVLFRRTYHRHFPMAFDYAVSPFLSLTHGNLSDAYKKIDDVLPEENHNSMAVVPQILGKEPEEFIVLANRLYEFGYTEVNWNLGCPMRKVAAKHRGSGLLPYPNEVDHILATIVPQLKPQLSVKVRLGLTSRDEIFRLIPILNNYPLKSVTIHPRLGRQQYSGHVDLDTFEQTLPLIKHPIIYNGDICTLEQYQTLVKRFPNLHDIMIGRGTLYCPTLPVEIRKGHHLDPDEKKLSTTSFLADLVRTIDEELPSDEAKLRKTKEYWCLLGRSLNITEQQARTVLHATTLNDVQQLISNFIQ